MPGGLEPVHLETEMRINPIGVDAQQPRFSWQLQANPSTARGLQQTAYRVLVASSPKLLKADRADTWDSGVVHSSDQLAVTFQGAPLLAMTRYWWKVMTWDQQARSSAWSEPAQWYSGMLGEAWHARWIAASADQPASRPTREGVDLVEQEWRPLPLFRRTFIVKHQVSSALVCVSGLGQYELRVNGKDVTATVMNPAWTDYRKRVLYNMYDVTALLKPGPNALGVMLGNGMYRVPNTKGRYTKFTGSFGQPKLVLRLLVRYSDGSITDVVTDSHWTTLPGPITFSSIYGGEDYDARRVVPGWDMASFAGKSWKPVIEVAPPNKNSLLIAQSVQPVIVAQTFHPVHRQDFSNGVSVYDLGKNFSGWPNIVVRGQAGSRIKLLPGELLNDSGQVTQASNNAHPGAENSFTYTLSGRGQERWHPQFSYNGFRYVQVERTPAKSRGPLPAISSVSGSFLHDQVEVIGRFQTSNQLLLQIHALIDQAILSNMFSVLTDCPTREKLGWLEQTHLAATSIMYNYDVRELYEAMADNMADEQTKDGLVPAIAPEFVAFVKADGESTQFRDTPEWGSAAILSPLAAYRFYGDRALLAAHYETMRRYLEFLGAKADRHILAYGLGDWYDIGPQAPGVSQLTGAGLTATAIYYQDLTGMTLIAEVLGKQEDGARYKREAAEVKQAFNARFFHAASSQYDSGSQTADAMPLVLGLVPEEQRQKVLDNLVADVRKHNDHVTAGDIGFHYVVRALTDAGRSDVLFAMLSRTDAPSYGYQLARGATALTEAWDSNPSSSQNHFMLGHAEEWFYRGLAGIEIDMSRQEGEQIQFQPRTLVGVASSSASVDSVYGLVSSGWRRSGGGTLYDITVPAGHSARLVLEVGDEARVSEGETTMEHSLGVTQLKRDGRSMTCMLGSGLYHFMVRE